MRLPRTEDDERPFSTQSTAAADVSRMVGGEGLGQLVEAEATQGFRQRIEQWAQRRGLPVANSMITVAADGVTARAPLYDITAETAVVRTTAAQPVKMSLTIEPKSWTQRVFGGGSFKTGDVGFDRLWRVAASEEPRALQLLDEDCREALREIGCWCRATYADGEIEVRLDHDRLAGTHVLGGIEIALRLAQARISKTAYR